MSQFYNDMAASVLRADYTIYLILAYLTFFRLEELTFPEYQRFIESQEPDNHGEPPPPQFTLAKYVLDFGNIVYGSTKKKSFRVRNMGWGHLSPWDFVP